jgi:regulator of sigma D
MLHRAVFPLVVVSSLMPQQAPTSSEVENELRQRTQELLDAVAPGRVDVWRRLLHERMIHVDEQGIVRTKSELLAEIQPLPTGLEGTLQIATFQVQLHGDVAVATHEERETLMYFGQKLDSRFRTTDTWLRTSEGWRLIAAQVLAVPADPPAIRLDTKTLCAYEGVFALTADITATVSCRDGELVAERQGRPPAIYRPETDDVFFSPGQPRTRRIFQRDSTGTITGFVDRREGHDIVWRRIR